MSQLLWKDNNPTEHGLTAHNFSRGCDIRAGLTGKYLECNAAKTGVVVKEGTIIPFKSGSSWRAQLFSEDEECATLDTGTLALGNDYNVYLCDNETDDGLLLISLNTTAPEGYTVDNSRKIGGFHYGRIRNSITIADVAVAVVPNSVYDLINRPRCSPRGMAKSLSGFWFDIYLASLKSALTFNAGDGSELISGEAQSVYGGTPLTGTEGLNGNNFIELAEMSEKRLLTLAEWLQVAKGSPQGNDGDNDNAWTETTNSARTTCGAVANAISLLNAVDCVGNVYEWLDEYLTRGDHGTSAAWVDVYSGMGVGQIHGYGSYPIVQVLAGLNWNDGVRAGSRSLRLSRYPWDVDTDVGCRFACDPL